MIPPLAREGFRKEAMIKKRHKNEGLLSIIQSGILGDVLVKGSCTFKIRSERRFYIQTWVCLLSPKAE